MSEGLGGYEEASVQGVCVGLLGGATGLSRLLRGSGLGGGA